MRRENVIELLIIAAILALVAGTSFAEAIPRLEFPLGVWVGYGAAVLFGQSLVRDSVRWLRRRRTPGETRRLKCLCAETTLGLGLLVVAVALTLIGAPQPVGATPVQLLLGLLGIFTVGFFTKDFVIVIRRVTDHENVVL